MSYKNAAIQKWFIQFRPIKNRYLPNSIHQLAVLYRNTTVFSFLFFIKDSLCSIIISNSFQCSWFASNIYELLTTCCEMHFFRFNMKPDYDKLNLNTKIIIIYFNFILLICKYKVPIWNMSLNCTFSDLLWNMLMANMNTKIIPGVNTRCTLIFQFSIFYS